MANNPDVTAFFNELDAVCNKFQLSIAHEDNQGAFIIQAYSPNNMKWLRDAIIATPVEWKSIRTGGVAATEEAVPPGVYHNDKLELLQLLSNELRAQLNARPALQPADYIQINLSAGSISVDKLADTILNKFDLVEKSATVTLAVDEFNLTNAEALFIGKVLALIGMVQFAQDCFTMHTEDRTINELIQEIKTNIWHQHPTDADKFAHAIIRRWLQLFTVVQERCADIDGWPELRFSVLENRGLIEANLVILSTKTAVQAEQQLSLIVRWNLHNLRSPIF
jgi:hypothetical protein